LVGQAPVQREAKAAPVFNLRCQEASSEADAVCMGGFEVPVDAPASQRSCLCSCVNVCAMVAAGMKLGETFHHRRVVLRTEE
jgi:hypothetical protein